mgnify:CR=1 FL=1
MKVSDTPLENAIALVKQGKHIEAQKLLKSLIAEDQHNLTAWFWLVETCTTNIQRLNVLEMCLEYNPDNQQVKQALEKLRTLSTAQLSAPLPKYERKRPLEKSGGKYKPLIKLSVISAFILVAINYLLPLFFRQNESSYFLYLFFVFPFTPFLSLPATAIVYFIYSSQRRGVFFLTAIGIPLIFNLVGASILMIPALIDSMIHPPATVSLTGEYSDKIGTLYGEKSLDVSVGVTTDRAGDFTIGAQLIVDGQIISTANTDTSLIPGDNTVIIQFPGSDISRYQLNGPYQVKVLPISDWQKGGYIDVRNNSWQTATYYWNSFGGEIVCYTLSAGIRPNPSAATMTISPAPNCTNGQYLADTRVTLQVVPKPGFRFVGWCGDYGEDIHSTITTFRMERNMSTTACLEPEP